MSDRIPMTRAGYNKIKAEMDHLKDVIMPQIAEKIAEARAEGDLRENAEYHGARENQGMTQAKINLLSDKLARAQIIESTNLPKDEVAFGCWLKVKDLDFDEIEEYTLVGAGEEDFDTGKILFTSPLAQGMAGKKVGDICEIKVPRGVMRYEILEIRHDD